MKIVLATSNPGKLKEFQALLQHSDFEISIQSDYGVIDADETGITFAENALIKARHASQQTGLCAIADDSGLEVDYLNGGPGIYSARFAGKGATDKENREKLLAALQGVPTEARKARFQCVIAMVRNADDPDPVFCRGCWEGQITEVPSGENGFGYDSVFYIPEFGCTSAELSPRDKNKNSHRGKALRLLREQLVLAN